MAADPAAVAAAAARALEAHQLRLEKHFGFRIDRDLHQPWCSGSVADPSSGRLTRTGACLEDLLAKYRLTDVQLEAEGMPERVRLSAAAAPMGFSLGRMGLELTVEGCRPGEYKDASKSDMCTQYAGGYWCESGTECTSPPDKCGGVQYFCRGFAGYALREEVDSGHYTTGETEDEALRTGQQLCPAGFFCVPYCSGTGAPTAPWKTRRIRVADWKTSSCEFHVSHTV